ncbi:MAG: hypothetical protein PHY47_18725 [Lachnospiraceae bacterium]|nr:hypothetical protein [Lachnospiraceae bacterium]
MNEEKNARKLEARRIKGINNSLSYLSNSSQKELGVMAIQKEENVFFCGNNTYKKIYTFKPALLNNKRLELLKALCRMFHNRIRLSLCLKNKDEKLNAYMFMTVTFIAASYYEVQKEIISFESEINRNICSILHIQIVPCNLDNTLTFIHMNCTGEMKKIDTEKLFQKKLTGALFAEATATGPGVFKRGSRYGALYIGKDFPQETEDIMKIFQLYEGTYQMCIDFQSYTDEDKEIFQYELKNKFCQDARNKEDMIVNATYLLTFISESKDSLSELDEKIVDYYDKKNILLMPGVDRERDIQKSMCTLGLSDFHSMQNVNINVLSELLM